MSEQFVEVLSRVHYIIITARVERIVWDIDYRLQGWHGLEVYRWADDVAREEQFGFRMVHYVVDLLRRELMLYRHCHSPVGERCQESCCPCRAVASAESYLVAFADAALTEEDMQLCNLSTYVVILQGGSLVVGQGIVVPVVSYAFFYYFVESRHTIHCTQL